MRSALVRNTARSLAALSRTTPPEAVINAPSMRPQIDICPTFRT
jgi:hypothetical protein